MKIRLALAVVAATIVFSMPRAEAIEWIRTKDIKSVCQQFLTKPNSPSGFMCVSYVQGFLDGIKATEPARYEATGSHSNENSNYSLELAGVCLPRSAGVNQILRVAARGIANASLEPRDPETSAINALRNTYGCEEENHDSPDVGREINDVTQVSDKHSDDEREEDKDKR